MTDDIVERLRKWTISRTAVPCGDLMDEAADEIERLRENRNFWLRQSVVFAEHADNLRDISRLYRGACRPNGETATDRTAAPAESLGATEVADAGGAGACPYVVGRTTRYCSLTPFTLTDAEREAIAGAAESYAANDDDEDCARVAATLRGVLERAK